MFKDYFQTNIDDLNIFDFFLKRATLFANWVFIMVFKFWVGILIFMYIFPFFSNFGKFPSPSNFYSKVAYTFFIDISFIQSQNFMSFVAYWPWAFNIAWLKQKLTKGCLNYKGYIYDTIENKVKVRVLKLEHSSSTYAI